MNKIGIEFYMGYINFYLSFLLVTIAMQILSSLCYIVIIFKGALLVPLHPWLVALFAFFFCLVFSSISCFLEKCTSSSIIWGILGKINITSFTRRLTIWIGLWSFLFSFAGLIPACATEEKVPLVMLVFCQNIFFRRCCKSCFTFIHCIYLSTKEKAESQMILLIC